MEQQVIYTIGHSTHPAEYFLELLQSYRIDFLGDVRSVAASRYNPQFNGKTLSAFLALHNIRYHHFSKEFGARRTDPRELMENGQVDFEKVRRSEEFLAGMSQLKMELQRGARIALMCSEGDPFNCHRFAMISVALEQEGLEVLHILKDKSLLRNADLEEQLLKKYAKKLPALTIFDEENTREKRLQFAYRLRNFEVAYAGKK